MRPWTTSVKTITVKVRKMTRSRSGNGDPLSVVKGRASAAASETEPRIPAHPFTVRRRQLARRSRWLARRSRLRMSTVTRCVQNQSRHDDRGAHRGAVAEQLARRAAREAVEDHAELEAHQG